MNRVTKTYKTITSQKYSVHRLILVYILLAAVVGIILYLRFPNNVDYANYYGEDGSVYLQNILDKGWIGGSLTPFNGYSIIGLYLICAAGWLINLVFLSGSLLTLATAFSIAAIGFMAAVIALPYVLFGRSFGKLKMLTVLLLGALLPLPVSPHIVIGTIGNQKWIFLYLAYLLVLYRLLNYKRLGWKRLAVIDGAILISAYTNSTAYCLVPLLFLPYIYEYFTQKTKGRRKNILVYIKRQVREKYTVSLIALITLLIPQVLYVAINGIPKIANYLDTPYASERGIELFVNRTYLFGITHELNGRLNDTRAIILFALIIIIAVLLLNRREKIAFFAGVYAAGAASLLFTINRPGVTDHFFNYSENGSGPDQFFYAQTLIMYLPFILLAFRLGRQFGHPVAAYATPAIFIAFVTASGIHSTQHPEERWRNASVFENDAGTFTDQAISACRQDKEDEKVKVTVYPYKEGTFSLMADRNKICGAELKRYQDSAGDTGLALNNNDHIPLQDKRAFTQTFKSEENGLEGTRVYFSTFGRMERAGEYKFMLLDEKCDRPIREVNISTRIIDNSYYNIRFSPIDDSNDAMYCFTINPPDTNFDLLAVQVSVPDRYGDGQLAISGGESPKDLVFMPLYTQERR